MLLAVHPNRLVAASVAVQPAGTSLKLRRTRSKKLELRLTFSGMATVPPVSGTSTAGRRRVLTLNVPSAAIAADIEQGLVGVVRVGGDGPAEVAEVAQRLAHLLRGRQGRLALYSATAPVDGREPPSTSPTSTRSVAPGFVDQMHLPGAMMSTSEPKLLKFGERVIDVVGAPREAAVPAEPAGLAVRVCQGRDRDDLVVGRGNEARCAAALIGGRGDDRDAALVEATDRLVQDVLDRDAAVPASLPLFATLMLTASIRGRLASTGSRWARIQSSPHTYHESSPYPSALRIRTAQMRAPGATPTTPVVLSSAATVPATCVPWPFSSRHSVRSLVEQFTPPTTFRSGCRATPVSTMATSEFTRSSTLSMFAVAERRAPTRETPVGVVWAVMPMTSSGTTATTLGSDWRARRCSASSFAEKAWTARSKRRSALMPSRWRWFVMTAAVSAVGARMTM